MHPASTAAFKAFAALTLLKVQEFGSLHSCKWGKILLSCNHFMWVILTLTTNLILNATISLVLSYTTWVKLISQMLIVGSKIEGLNASCQSSLILEASVWRSKNLEIFRAYVGLMYRIRKRSEIHSRIINSTLNLGGFNVPFSRDCSCRISKVKSQGCFIWIFFSNVDINVLTIVRSTYSWNILCCTCLCTREKKWTFSRSLQDGIRDD